MTLTETFGPIYLCQMITSTESGPVSVSHADDEGKDCLQVTGIAGLTQSSIDSR
jgi:hypothetical protein